MPGARPPRYWVWHVATTTAWVAVLRDWALTPAGHFRLDSHPGPAERAERTARRSCQYILYIANDRTIMGTVRWAQGACFSFSSAPPPAVHPGICPSTIHEVGCAG